MRFTRPLFHAATALAAFTLLSPIAVAASDPNRSQLPVIPNPGVNPKRLTSGSTYSARLLPLPVHLTIPTGVWAGAQWTSQTANAQPSFGWLEVGHPLGNKSAGLIDMTSYAKTPSAAATLQSLRTRGIGATYRPSVKVTVAGYSGFQFDGEVTGRGHNFIPFTPANQPGNSLPKDHFGMDKGEVFRIIVLSVRGKTAVIVEENFGLPSRRFARIPEGGRTAA